MHATSHLQLLTSSFELPIWHFHFLVGWETRFYGMLHILLRHKGGGCSGVIPTIWLFAQFGFSFQFLLCLSSILESDLPSLTVALLAGGAASKR